MYLAIQVVDLWPAPTAPPAATDEGDLMVLTFGGPPPGDAVEGRDYHVVQAGDTLASISHALFGDEAAAPALAERNGLSDPIVLVPGQLIWLR